MLLDTFINFYAPRACLALDLGCDLDGIVLSTNEVLDANVVGLNMFPNPANAEINLTTNANAPIESVYVYNLTGQLVKAHTAVNASQFTMQRNSLANGMYMVRVNFKEGFVTQRLMLN